ncbi:DNA mismatch repair protein Msh6-like protein [Sarcoptes scabiei]|uniref:DNA mismatch repair protein n=1 Tax=Sarcoptes scabiei TaxID=52283 RepID=A0A132A5P5_SARSC|nr:DNA mismatch repair protein Msh6-like protein [Sarcoptes scabiei]
MIGQLHLIDCESGNDSSDRENTPRSNFNQTPKRKNRIDHNEDECSDDDDFLRRKKTSKKFKHNLSDSDESEDDGDEYQPDHVEESSEISESDDDSSSLESDHIDSEDSVSSKKVKFIKKFSHSKQSLKSKSKVDEDDFLDDDDDMELLKSKTEAETDRISNLKIQIQKLTTKNDEDEIQSVKIVDNQDLAFRSVKIDQEMNLRGKSDDEDFQNDSEYSILERKKNFQISANLKNVEKPSTAEQADKTQWPHLSYDFLQLEKIKDRQGNRMFLNYQNKEINPDYDPSTLFVPQNFLNEQTPAHRQWWEMKSLHFDTILFFKMGKFYEFFHMDAVVCTKELKILFMRGEIAHAGFPEKSYKQYADALIQKGYKVARVEQTETPEMMAERCKTIKKASKFDKVVKREICRISTIGTRYLSDIDSDTILSYNSYLMSIVCRTNQTDDNQSLEYGVCFVDVSVGKFFLSQFKDDRFNSKLRIVLSHFCPVEIILERSSKMKKLIQSICPMARLQEAKNFWSSSQSLKYVYEKDLWSNVPDKFRQSILDPKDVIQQTAREEYCFATVALGAVLSYLDDSLILDDITTMKQFEIYEPPEYDYKVSKLPNHMILDSMTMKNLEIFNSSSNISNNRSFTLFKLIDNCGTAFGKRQLHSWLCQPICFLRESLELRQEAVRELNENENFYSHLKQWQTLMKKLPDLDRLLTQIHSQSLLKSSKNHPDSRAIMFESDVYQKRKIKTFLDVLAGFEKILTIIRQLRECVNDNRSRLLKQLILYSDEGGSFPRIDDRLKFFQNSFNHEKVLREGNFIPDKGVDEEYDKAIEEIQSAERQLNEYLNQQQLKFKTRITYCHANKNRYMMEVPDSVASKLSRSEEKYELKSARKGFKRFHTDALIELVGVLEEAEQKRTMILGDIFRRLLAKFDSDFEQWQKAISLAAQIDALMSLAHTRQIFESNGSKSCLPEIVWDRTDPFIRIKELRNAFLVINNNQTSNDLELCGETLILTGPNMSGKTTLMRSVGLVTILAQIGAYVPASECTLTPVDRIFTRIGAYDLVLENQSSFMVELSEAMAIIKYATPFSLALIDELGSGTSTFDGTAIASAIITNLTEKNHCRIIFSTHYHSILDEVDGKSNIKLGYMSYMIENENDQDPTEENIIFLYRLQSGICNKSYGFNVSKLAGIPQHIIRRAYNYAEKFELELKIKSILNWFRERKNHDQCLNANADEKQRMGIELQNAIQKFNEIEQNNPI